MSQALDALGPLADRGTPVFVTVDPERDTVEQLATYQQSFHPSFLMLTGTPEQVSEAARASRVYFRKAETASATDYLMANASITIRMEPNGHDVPRSGHQPPPARMAEHVHGQLRQEERPCGQEGDKT